MEKAATLARDLVGEVGRAGALIFVAQMAVRERGWGQGARLAWAVLRAR